MLFEVDHGRFHQGHVLPEVADPLIAPLAQETSRRTGWLIVIHRQDLELSEAHHRFGSPQIPISLQKMSWSISERSHERIIQFLR